MGGKVGSNERLTGRSYPPLAQLSDMDICHPKQSDTVETHGPCSLMMTGKMTDLIAGRFRALGEPYRLRILQVLRHREMTVGEVVQSLDGNQPNVSRHLQILYRAGIVNRRRDGICISYSLREPSVFRLCELVHQNEIRERRDQLAAVSQTR